MPEGFAAQTILQLFPLPLRCAAVRREQAKPAMATKTAAFMTALRPGMAEEFEEAMLVDFTPDMMSQFQPDPNAALLDGGVLPDPRPKTPGDPGWGMPDERQGRAGSLALMDFEPLGLSPPSTSAHSPSAFLSHHTGPRRNLGTAL